MRNLIDDEPSRKIRNNLESILQSKLKRIGDEFLPGNAYIKKWGYKIDETGTMGYTL
jgi:hypothetical protein